MANSFHGGDASTGCILSPGFVISKRYISLLIGGGNHYDSDGEVLAGAQLIIDNAAVRGSTGSDTEELLWQNWDVIEFRGKTARVRLVDEVTEGWGHTVVDTIVQTDEPKSSYDINRLKRYRDSPGYYGEPYRPRYHFTPELNWMNDPNGLVFFEGEYHLFYQHNPFGNSWGHMTWGHAVSTDLVHWEHLPIAIWEEHGVMIFSGCAVVDHNNTSGFGEGGAAPLVAIYSSHQRGKQAQCLAYSNDRGRSWTKHRDNPVLDLQEQDFRDPKVFWHEGTDSWVMVVSMAVDKRLQFYGSDDLKSWSLLSEFGPAGAEGKSNWECPDLFELEIETPEGEMTGETRWVLEVDMGDGSIAGGSGGEYFIGQFDGRRFTNESSSGSSHWVDYGRDFYAPVSWSDIPAEDGRRIWIGWMNNWQTCLLPTDPWRSAMSVPRRLSLRESEDGLRLIQRPVAELNELRGDGIKASNLSLPEAQEMLQGAPLVSQSLDIVLEVAFNGAESSEEMIELEVLKGEGESTLIGYDRATEQLYVDRTKSGESDFHAAFAGRHVAPLRLTDGLLRIRVLVDASSVEVFADDGLVVITDRVFPAQTSKGLGLRGSGGLIQHLEVWEMASVWNRESDAPAQRPLHVPSQP